MSSISLRLPESLHKQARELAIDAVLGKVKRRNAEPAAGDER